MDDIAIIGIGLRFPGCAKSPEELWNSLQTGKSQWSEFPNDRLSVDGYYHPAGDRQGTIPFKGGHFLSDDIAAFDASFFSITADDAKAIDPQQRLLLEVSYEALENGGLRKEDIDGSNTAVYVGSFVKDYEQICLRDPDWQPQYAATGNSVAIMANRISYFFNFHGPSMTIDTGCSGSLVAVHLAVQALRAGESPIAIAGGAGMILSPSTMMPMTALNFLSPDGKCFTFDSRANGYGRGEGIGVVVLKRLPDAVRDGDPIRAVIRGSKVNQDGRTTGITLPSKEAQVANIRATYEHSGLGFEQTAYVECHGTGTRAGDWRELKAISETIASNRSTDDPLLVGSVKPNIGHLEGAAGVAALIKGILMLENAAIPPNINFETGNPDIKFEEWKLKVPLQSMDWPISGIRRISVNCFGFGGTNAHVIVEQSPSQNLGSAQTLFTTVQSLQEKNGARDLRIESEPQYLLCFSSKESSGMARLFHSHSRYLSTKANDANADAEGVFLLDYAFTLNCRRSSMECKTYLVTSSVAELRAQMAKFDSSRTIRSGIRGTPKLVFLFAGQGSQWARMGSDLKRFRHFWNSLDAAGWYMKTALNSPFDLVEEIQKDADCSRINSPEISQPATTAIQVALVELLRSFGVTPKMVAGHSSGEIAASFAIGAISREAAWEIAYYRGLAAKSMAARDVGFEGAMLAVDMSYSEAREHLALSKSYVQLACVNSPVSVTLSGEANAIRETASQLSQQGISCRILKIATAYHSTHMDMVTLDYKDTLAAIVPTNGNASTKMFSSVTGAFIQGTELSADYWIANLVSIVEYKAAIESLVATTQTGTPHIFLELSPSTVLSALTTDIIAKVKPDLQATYISVLQRSTDGIASVFEAVGQIWSTGHAINMRSVVQAISPRLRPKCLKDIPPYPWNHSKSYWHESHLSLAGRFRAFGRQDLIGAPMADSIPSEPRWRGFLRISENPWLRDHQIQKTIIYPAAGLVSMVLEGARQMSNGVGNLLGFEILDMSIERAMVIPQTTHGLEVILSVRQSPEETGSGTGTQHFSIYSKALDRSWDRNATGTLRFQYGSPSCVPYFHHIDSASIEATKICKNILNPRQLYEHLDAIGLYYGPTFQNITAIRSGGESCVSRVRVPDTMSKMPAKFEFEHLLHPATLDAMLQTLFAIRLELKVPVFIKRMFVSADLNTTAFSEFVGHATARPLGFGDAEADIAMCLHHQPNSRVIVDGIRFTSLHLTDTLPGVFLPNYHNLCSEVLWKEDFTSANPATLPGLMELLVHKSSQISIMQVGGPLAVSIALLLPLAKLPHGIRKLQRYTYIAESGTQVSERLAGAVKDTRLEQIVETSSVLPPIGQKYDLIIVFTGTGVHGSLLSSRLHSHGVLLHASTTKGSPENILGGENCSSIESNVYQGAASMRHDWIRYFGTNLEDPDLGAVNKLYFVKDTGLHNSHQAVNDSLILLATSDYNHELQSFQRLISDALAPDGSGILVPIISPREVLQGTVSLERKCVISFLDLGNCPSNLPYVFHWDKQEYDFFHSMQQSTRALIWLTRGAHMKPWNPLGAPVVGLVRTLISEDPRKVIATLDLAIDSRLDAPQTAMRVLDVYKRCLQHNGGHAQDVEFAEEVGKLFIPRLYPVQSLNELIEDNADAVPTYTNSFQSYLRDESSKLGLRLDSESCISRGSKIRFSTFDRSAPSYNEVEVIFNKTVLVDRVADFATIRAFTSSIVLDIVGTVRRVGSAVTTIQPGDIVNGLLYPRQFIQDSICVDAKFLSKHQNGLIPSVYTCAYYGLLHHGKATLGKSILVHGGTNPYGLAVIELALAIGATLFVTVHGINSLQQQKIFEKRGIARECIFVANSVNFITALRSATHTGQGVDIVYCTTQDFIDDCFQCVSRCGTIVLCNSRAQKLVPVRLPFNSVTFVTFDLIQILINDPRLVSDMFQEVTKLVDRISLELTLSQDLERCFDISRLDMALIDNAENPHIGFVSVGVQTTSDESLVQITPDPAFGNASKFAAPEGTYILAGGLGGLGMSIAKLLASHGAKYFVFLSRSGDSTEESKEFISDFSKTVAIAEVICIDIRDLQGLQRVICNVETRGLPRICGVFHCVAVIRDAVFENMTYSDWAISFNPKAMGAWNLVCSIEDSGQDPFHIFLASSAGIIGNRGQANYAAANCFLDSLARHQRLRGRRAVSIDLGPILGAGMLAKSEEMLDVLRASGFFGIRHEDFIKVIKHAILMKTPSGALMPPQVILGVGTGGLISQNRPVDAYWSRTALFSQLRALDLPKQNPGGEYTQVDGFGMRHELEKCSGTHNASIIICNGLCSMLAKSLNMLPEEIDASRSPSAYGVDSLVAVGIRNWILGNCGIEISVFDILSEVTLRGLSKLVALGLDSQHNL